MDGGHYRLDQTNNSDSKTLPENVMDVEPTTCLYCRGTSSSKGPLSTSMMIPGSVPVLLSRVTPQAVPSPVHLPKLLALHVHKGHTQTYTSTSGPKHDWSPRVSPCPLRLCLIPGISSNLKDPCHLLDQHLSDD